MLQIGEINFAQLFSHAFLMLQNIWLWGALFCYITSILLWMIILSKVEVSYAYPLLSIGYIAAAIAGYMLFNENLSLIRIIGIFVICIGVILITRS